MIEDMVLVILKTLKVAKKELCNLQLSEAAQHIDDARRSVIKTIINDEIASRMIELDMEE